MREAPGLGGPFGASREGINVSVQQDSTNLGTHSSSEGAAWRLANLGAESAEYVSALNRRREAAARLVGGDPWPSIGALNASRSRLRESAMATRDHLGAVGLLGPLSLDVLRATFTEVAA